MEEKRYISRTINWRGIDIKVSYCQDYSVMPDLGLHMTHTEIRSKPLDEPLKYFDVVDMTWESQIPITSTGYKSHFAPFQEGMTLDSICDWILEWCDKENDTPKSRKIQKLMKERKLEKSQPDLFAVPLTIQPTTTNDMKAKQADIEGNTEPIQVLDLIHIDTGSHGYVKVSHELLYRILKGKLEAITGFSGIDKSYAYLEEDQDATFFAHMAREKGYEIRYIEEYKPQFRTHHNYDPKRVSTPMGKGNATEEIQSSQMAMFEPQKDLFR